MEEFWNYVRGVDSGKIIFNPTIFLQIMKDAGIVFPEEEEKETPNVDLDGKDGKINGKVQ